MLRIRIPLPAALVTISLPTHFVEQLKLIVGEASKVWEVPSPSAAYDLLQRQSNTCLVLAVPRDNESDLTTGLARLRSAYPRVPATAVVVQGISSYRSVLRLGALGVTEIVEANPNLDRHALLMALSRCHADGVAARLWTDGGIEVPERMRLLLRAALRLAHEPVSVVMLADVLGMHERTLRKYCEQNGLPSPQWIIGWARILIAAYYLDEPARALTSTAKLLQYASACALRNQLRRYIGVSPTTLRSNGALRSVSDQLKFAVRVQLDQADSAASTRPLLRLMANSSTES